MESWYFLRAARTFGGGRRGCGVAGTGPNMAPRGNLTEYLLLCLNTICGRWRRAGERVPNPGALPPRAVPVAQAGLLGGGDDYELCFTAAPAKRSAVERAALKARTRVTRIGRVIRAPEGACSVAVVDRDGLPLVLQQKGFDHFG